MRGIDLSPYRRATVGFDRLFDFLEGASRAELDNFPPFDIEKPGEDSYRITLAVAGFRPEELEVTQRQNMLIVSGRKTESREGTFLHVGIAARAFERRFELADFIRVTGASLADGLLSIELVRELPEAMKPRRIEIATAQPRLAATGEAAAKREARAA